jgi:hypothetical protein
MALSKREKMIAGVVGLCALIFIGDYYVVEPLLANMEDLRMQQSKVTEELQKAQGVFNNRRAVNDAWRGLMKNGLTTNAADANIKTQHALTEWASAARVNLESQKSDTPVQVGDFQQVRITVTGAGTMAGISRLIWDIETGPLPLQLGELRIQSRKDGTDDLGLQLTVTTLVYAPLPPATPAKKAASAGGAA